MVCLDISNNPPNTIKFNQIKNGIFQPRRNATSHPAKLPLSRRYCCIFLLQFIQSILLIMWENNWHPFFKNEQPLGKLRSKLYLKSESNHPKTILQRIKLGSKDQCRN